MRLHGIAPRAVAGLLPLWLLASVLSAQQAAPRIRQAVNDRAVVRLRGNTYPLARPRYDRGAAPPDLQLKHMLLVLRRSPQQEAVLEQLLDEQRESGSPEYHHWLTPAEFGARFGPAPSDITAVIDWLTRSGFHIDRVAAGRGTIEFSGEESNVEAAFHTAIHRYEIRGASHWANASDPAIPQALTPVVAGVVSLNNFRKEGYDAIRRVRLGAQGEASPDLSVFNPDGTLGHILAPIDLRAIYNIDQGWPGDGQTIAVVGRSDVDNPDITDFRSTFGEYGPFQTIAAGTDPGIGSTDDFAEATLDSEWAAAAAPNAHVELVVAAGTATTDGIDLAAQYVVDKNLTAVVSLSYGLCEAAAGAGGNQFWLDLWQQAAAQGMTVLVSAGDSGAAGCDDPNSEGVASQGLAVNALASTPYDIAVGGTEINDYPNTKYWPPPSAGLSAPAYGYIPETAWNQSVPASQGQPALWAGGGGRSNIYAKPAWQSGPGVPNDNARDLPDISLNAGAAHGYAVCWKGSCTLASNGTSGIYVFSGTSASAPALAGLMAQLDQKEGGRQGLVTPYLYRMAADGSSTPAFHDIVSGSNEVPCTAGSPDCSGGTLGFPATAGYDLATGLGSVNGSQFLQQWRTARYVSTTTTLQLSPPNPWNYGDTVPIMVKVTGDAGGPMPTGTVALAYRYSNGYSAPLQTLMLDANGEASTTTSVLSPDDPALTAAYGGDNFYNESSTSQNIQVNRDPTSTSLTVYELDSSGNKVAVTSATYGDPVIFQAQVTTANKLVPSGDLGLTDVFMPNTQDTLASTTLDASGSGRLIGALEGGQHSYAAQYPGSFDFAPSQSQAVAISVRPAPTTISLAPSKDGSGAIIATVGSTQRYGYNPAGTITLFDGGLQVGSESVTHSSFFNDQPIQANYSFYLPVLPGASASLTAAYSGDENFLPSTSAPLTVPTVADVVAAPNTLDFGTVPVASTTSKMVTFTNAGGSVSEPVKLLSTTPGFTAVGCGSALAAGASCQMTLTFNPMSAGDESGGLDFSGDGSAGTAALQVKAIAIGFQIKPPANPTISAGQTATIPLTLAIFGGFSGAVSFSCSGLPAGSSCSFAPPVLNVDGSSNSASVVLSIATAGAAAAGAGGWPHDLEATGGALFLAGMLLLAGMTVPRRRAAPLVLGLGLIAMVACGGGGGAPVTNSPPAGSAQLGFSPQTLNFGSVQVGLSASLIAKLINSGDASIDPQPANITAPFSDSSNCPATLAPASSCEVEIKFAPTQLGPASASVAIPGTAAKLSASGSGISNLPPGVSEVQVTATAGSLSSTSKIFLTVN